MLLPEHNRVALMNNLVHNFLVPVYWVEKSMVWLAKFCACPLLNDRSDLKGGEDLMGAELVYLNGAKS